MWRTFREFGARFASGALRTCEKHAQKSAVSYPPFVSTVSKRNPAVPANPCGRKPWGEVAFARQESPNPLFYKNLWPLEATNLIRVSQDLIQVAFHMHTVDSERGVVACARGEVFFSCPGRRIPRLEMHFRNLSSVQHSILFGFIGLIQNLSSDLEIEPY